MNSLCHYNCLHILGLLYNTVDITSGLDITNLLLNSNIILKADSQFLHNGLPQWDMAMLFSTLLLQCALSSASSFSVLTPLSYSPDTTTLVNFASDPIVKTTNGSISGKFLPTYEQDAFLGIPFAAPPVGPLRFRAPQPLNTSWTDVRPAKTYGPGCAQWSSNTNVKEDCLTLNGMHSFF
jgi:hypothetical protein